MAEDNCDVMWLSCDHRNNNSVIHMEVWAGFFLHWSCFWHLQGWEGPSACRWRHWQHSSFPSCWFSSIVHAVWKWRQSESGKSILSFQELSLLLQVVDGFFVKRVQDVRESAAYLTVMTRYLTKLYQVCLLFLGSEVRVMEIAVCLMCFKRNLFFFSSKSQLQNCVLTCRSRELEGDGESEVQGAGTPSCSLISFAEFNHGAVKNKVCIYSCYNLWGKHCKAFKRLLCSSCVYGHNN